MTENDETILPPIRLKYFVRPDSRDTGDEQCGNCKARNVLIGGMFFPENGGDPFPVCEDCAIDNFMVAHGYTNREAARARRRRMFDIGYLLTEIMVDEVLRNRGLSSISELPEGEWEKIRSLGTHIFNEFPREEKLRLEQIVDQAEIERRLRVYLTQRVANAWSEIESD